MAEDPLFKEIVRNSFKKVKDHMNSLEAQIKAQKDDIRAIRAILEKKENQKTPNSNEVYEVYKMVKVAEVKMTPRIIKFLQKRKVVKRRRR